MKSAFEELKDTIKESVGFAKNLIDLKERLETILQEYDFEEEQSLPNKTSDALSEDASRGK